MADMTEREWLDFLAGTHVAVIGVDRERTGPLLAPVWYEYDPEDGFRVAMDGRSPKAHRLRAEGRATICVQSDAAPYMYVIAEGPVTISDLSIDEARAHLAIMASRYLGSDAGSQYAADFSEPNTVLVTLQPSRWRAEVI